MKIAEAVHENAAQKKRLSCVDRALLALGLGYVVLGAASFRDQNPRARPWCPRRPVLGVDDPGDHAERTLADALPRRHIPGPDFLNRASALKLRRCLP
jgi:hypothetical protein